MHQLEAGHGSSCNLKSMLPYTRAGSSTGSGETLHGLIFLQEKPGLITKRQRGFVCVL